jgi:hypothetical protein
VIGAGQIECFSEARLIEAERNDGAAAFLGARARPLIDQVMVERAFKEIAEPPFRAIHAGESVALQETKEKPLHEILGLGGLDLSRDEEAKERLPVELAKFRDDMVAQVLPDAFA